MANTFNLHIRSANRDFYEGECVSLTLPVSDGHLGLLAGHSPLVAAVVPGKLTCRLADGTSFLAAAGAGIVRFERNDALVLLDSIERPEEIDVARAQRAADEAREALAKAQTPQEREQARSDLVRAESRLQTAPQERD